MNIWEGYEPSYPAPGSSTSTPTPYPVLNPDDGFARAVPSIEDTARGYLTLAQYFEIGKEQPQEEYVLVEDDCDALEEDGEAFEDGGADEEGEEVEEDAQEATDANHGLHDDALEREDDSQLHIESTIPPTPNQTTLSAPDPEDIWTSLPGTHNLPDEDFLASRTEDVWPHRLDPSTKPPLHIAAPIFRDSGVRRPTTRGRPRGRPRGRRGWKWALRGTTHEDMFQSPKITADAAGTKRRGGGAKRGRGRPRGRRRGTTSTREPEHVDPGEAFKDLQAKATVAFLDNDLVGALELTLQAITENPEVPAAHFLIDQVLTAQGRHNEAFEAHWMAVLTSRDPEAWVAHGERLLALAGDNKTDRDYDAAFRCLTEAVKLDKNNLEIRARKVDLLVEMKAYKNAFKECQVLLKFKPGDTDTLWQLAELLKLAQNGKEPRRAREERTPRVIEAYRTAFHEWRGEAVFGDPDMQWAHVDMYVGLLEDAGTPVHDCIRELKQISRWLLGRGHEIFWDSLSDDREYDLTPERRIQTDFWRSRMFAMDEPRYGNGLPLWLRARLGCMRARLGFLHREEALRHLSILLVAPGAAEDNPETFMLTAERLCILGWYEDGVKFYEAAKDQDHTEGTRFFLGMGRCYKQLTRKDDAIKAIRSALDSDNESMDARIELARLYVETGRKVEAAEIARSISRLGRESIQRSEKTLLARTLPLAGEKPKPRPLAPNIQRRAQMSHSDVVLQRLPVESWANDGEGVRDSVEGLSTGGEPTGKDAGMEEDSSDDETESVPASSTATTPLPRRKPGQKGKVAHKEQVQQLWQQRLRVLRSHEMVKKLWQNIDSEGDGDQDVVSEWMKHAAAMAAEFTDTKVFYPGEASSRFSGLLAGKNAKTRQVIAEMDALREQMRDASMENVDEPENMPSAEDKTLGDFHDIPFQEWHHIMADLALQYARFADQQKCKDMLNALTRANVFRHDFALYNTTLALSIYCAIVFNDRDLFLDTSRQYLYQSDYRSGMAYQIYAAAGSIGYGEDPFDTDTSKIQQWTSKLVKMHDLLIMDPEMRAKWEWGVAEAAWKDQGQKRTAEPNEGLIPGLLTTYAHIMTSKRRMHTTTSLSYLFRALALRPDDVVVNLSLATNCIIDVLRKSDSMGGSQNRQKIVQQGLGFFYRYYNARVATGRKCYLQEAEYNAARIWDLLGWTHLAAKGYEKVLKLSAEVREEAEREGAELEDVASEAAYALQKIFIAAENEDAARAIGEEWLVL